MDNPKDLTQVLYREVFLSRSGIQVLADILNDCMFYSLEDLKGEADIARMNVGRRILGKLGTWDPDKLFELTHVLAGGNGNLGRLLDAHGTDDDQDI